MSGSATIVVVVQDHNGNLVNASAVRRGTVAEEVVQWAEDTLRAKKVIKQRLLDAGTTLRRAELPKEYLNLARVCAAWPDMVRTRDEHAAWKGKPTQRVRPTARQIDALDEVLRWWLWLDEDHRPILSAFAAGYSVRQVAALDPRGRSREKIRRMVDDAVQFILERLMDADARS